MNVYDDTTGTLLLKMKKSGETDINKIAEQMDALRKLQIKEGIFSFDCFTDKGSHTYSNLALQLEDKSTKACIIWSINHYLGLNRHPYVIAKAKQALDEFGTGCGTSAISGGMNILHKRIEEKLKKWLQTQSIILFPTGFTANMGLLAAICQEEDQILIDEYAHASIRDGIRLSAAKKWISFKHNSMEDLEEKLKAVHLKSQGKIIVVVESVYSMSGTFCPLKKLIALKNKYPFLLMVDEAHSFGLYGEHGKGLCQQEGVLNQVDFLTSTFSKATGSIGGFVATKSIYVSYLQWSANAFAFQACFTPADAATILAAMDIMEEHPEIIEKLHDNNLYMRQKLLASGFYLGESKSPIIPIYIPDTKKLMQICFALYKKGIFSVPISYPMVRKSEGRIRFIVNSNHSKEQIDKTVSLLTKLAHEYKLFEEESLA